MNKTFSRLGLLLLFLLLAGCSGNEEKSFDVLVLNQDNVLGPSAIQKIKSLNYPPGFAFAVCVVKSLEPLTVGAEADELFEKIAKLHPAEDFFEERGVLFVVSQRPALVQVRVGEKLHSVARWGGVTAGGRYIARQQVAASGNLDRGASEMVAGVVADLPKVSRLPWYKSAILHQATDLISEELEELSLPSNGFYGQFLLRPITRFRIIERAIFGSWWITFIVFSLVFVLIRSFIALVAVSAVERLAPSVLVRGIQLIITVLIGLALVIPSAGSAIFLSGSRLEDQIALKASGLPGAAALAFPLEDFDRKTSLLLALVVCGVQVLRGVAARVWLLRGARLPNEKQVEIFNGIAESDPIQASFISILGTGAGTMFEIPAEDFSRSPFGHAFYRPLLDDLAKGAIWGLLAFSFLPAALTLAALYLAIIPIALGVYEMARAYNLVPSIRFSLVGVLVLICLVAILLFLLLEAGKMHLKAAPGANNQLISDSKLLGEKIVRQDWSRVRAEPSLSGKELMKVRSGQRVQVWKEEGEWLAIKLKLNARNVEGWMHRSLFERNSIAASKSEGDTARSGSSQDVASRNSHSITEPQLDTPRTLPVGRHDALEPTAQLSNADSLQLVPSIHNSIDAPEPVPPDPPTDDVSVYRALLSLRSTADLEMVSAP